MRKFQDIRSALEYAVRKLIAKRRTFLVNIRGPKEAKRGACTVQVVAESMLFGNDERGLTLDLTFDPSQRQDARRLGKFLSTAAREYFSHYDFDGMDGFAMRFGTDVELALGVIQSVLRNVWGYPASTAFECQVSDEGPN